MYYMTKSSVFDPFPWPDHEIGTSIPAVVTAPFLFDPRNRQSKDPRERLLSVRCRYNSNSCCANKRHVTAIDQPYDTLHFSAKEVRDDSFGFPIFSAGLPAVAALYFYTRFLG